MEFEHDPVMAKEIIEIVKTASDSGVIIDATLGGAGHSTLMLQAKEQNRLIAFDRDPYAVQVAKERLSSFGERVEVIHSGFADIGKEIKQRNLQGEVSIVLFDLGVSSHQLDKKERGFTYRHDDAPLDMRMDSSQSLTAQTIVNEYSEDQLETILRENSDEKFSRAIAKEIIAARPLDNAGDLIAAIRKAIPHRFQRIGHPAKRTFQALRMEVNKELDQLQNALEESVHLLAPGGKIIVLSYHSGEDKIVKNIFKKYQVKSAQTKDGRLIPEVSQNLSDEETVQLIPVSAPKKPSSDENKKNPRAKSARLRVAQRVTQTGNFDQVSGL